MVPTKSIYNYRYNIILYRYIRNCFNNFPRGIISLKFFFNLKGESQSSIYIYIYISLSSYTLLKNYQKISQNLTNTLVSSHRNFFLIWELFDKRRKNFYEKIRRYLLVPGKFSDNFSRACGSIKR